MNRRLVVALLWLIPSFGWGFQTATDSPKPLSQVELLSLLIAESRRGVADRVLEKRGIDFQPTESYIDALKAAHASDELIEKVRKAGASAGTRAAPPPVDDSTARKQQQILSYLLQVVSLEKNLDLKRAQHELRAAVAMDPGNPLLHLDLASVLTGSKEKRGLEDAISEERRAVDLAPDMPIAHWHLADDLYKQHDLAGAAAEYRKVLQLDADDVDTCNQLGASQERAGDLDDAVASYQQALARGPGQPWIRIELVYLLARKDDFDGALFQAREAVKAAPANATVHRVLARALRTKGDAAGAAKEEQAAQALEASNPPKRIRVDRVAMAEKLLYQARPEYPAKAKAIRLQGMVRFSVSIAPDGTIKDLELASGHPLLTAAAAQAVERSRYQPTLLNGEMVEVQTDVDVLFTLEDP